MRRDVFQAIADPTRRAILTLLAVQAMTPNDLAEYFSTSRQAVSKHLHILNECGLLKQRQTGREVHYSLHAAEMQALDVWLQPFRSLWQQRFSQLDDVLQKTKVLQKPKNKRS